MFGDTVFAMAWIGKRQLHPIGFPCNQNGFSSESAGYLLCLRVSPRHRENQPILKAIKKDFLMLAPEAAGTSIALSLVRTPSGESRYGRFRKESP